MLNQVIIVGRLTDDPSVTKTEANQKKTVITVAVHRSYKNAEGIYETDFIRCILWNAIASNTSEYCKKGDVVGIKGRIQTGKYVDKEGQTKYVVEVIAEKVTFLSGPKKALEEAT